MNPHKTYHVFVITVDSSLIGMGFGVFPRVFEAKLYITSDIFCFFFTSIEKDSVLLLENSSRSYTHVENVSIVLLAPITAILF